MGWLIFMWFVILIVMLILYFIMIAFKVSKLYHDIEKRRSKTEKSERMFHGSNELCKARTHRRCVRAEIGRASCRERV